MNNEFRLRVLFYRTSSGNEPVREWLKALQIQEGDIMVLLHGFIKKSQKTPAADLKLARQRLRDLLG